MSNTCSGAVVVHRLRTGDTVKLTLSSDKPLFQICSEEGVINSPSWEVEANQPTISVTIVSQNNKPITVQSVKWYNGNYEITNADTTYVKSAAGNPSTLKIVKNIASASNLANDVITFEANISVGGIEQVVRGSITIEIIVASENSYYGYLIATPSTGGDANNTVKEGKTLTITPYLTYGGAVINDFSVKWYKNNTDAGSRDTTHVSGKNLTVDAGMVDGVSVFICKFFIGETEVEGAFFTVTDESDEFQIYCDQGADVQTKEDIQLTFHCRSWKTQTDVSNASITWLLTKMDAVGLTSLGTSATNVITVTLADLTDASGADRDVVVTAVASF